MLGFIGRWAASKGMVAVPNLIGLLNTAAQTAIANSGLTFSSSSTTNTEDSGLANKVASQTPTSGTLADYESSVSFVYYTYVAPPFFPFFPPFFPPYFAPAPFFPPYFAPVVATITNLTYTATGSTTGTLSWNGTNIESYMYTGSPDGASTYPSPYNYGTFTATWPGNLVNMVQGQSYAASIAVMPGGASQNITFTHSYANAFPSFTSAPVVSSKTSTSITYSWDGFDALSWELKDGATVITSGNGFGPQTATRTGLTPNTSYTSSVKLWSGSGQTGNSAESAGVTATTDSTAPFFPPYFAPAPFFPPYFAPAPFFPPYFAPSEPSKLCTGYDVYGGLSNSDCAIVGECNPTATGDPC